MKQIRNIKGKSVGRINVVATLATLEVMEEWRTSNTHVDLSYLRNAASRVGSREGKQFTVNSPVESNGKIIVIYICFCGWRLRLAGT